MNLKVLHYFLFLSLYVIYINILILILKNILISYIFKKIYFLYFFTQIMNIYFNTRCLQAYLQMIDFFIIIINIPIRCYFLFFLF